jgi:hypothetical protein
VSLCNFIYDLILITKKEDIIMFDDPKDPAQNPMGDMPEGQAPGQPAEGGMGEAAPETGGMPGGMGEGGQKPEGDQAPEGSGGAPSNPA